MADHRPRIVAMIPKKMQVLEVCETDGPTTTISANDNRNNITSLLEREVILNANPVNHVLHAAATPATACHQNSNDSNARTLPSSPSPPPPPRNDDIDDINGNRSNTSRSSRVQGVQVKREPDLLLLHARNGETTAAARRVAPVAVPPSRAEPAERAAEPLVVEIVEIDEQSKHLKRDKLCQLQSEYLYDKERPYNYDLVDLVGLLRDIGTARKNMAAISQKSPKPTVVKGEKEDSFWEKIGTLGRKKRIKEVQEVQEEGKQAIDSPGLPHFPTTSPEDYDLEENEVRCMVDQSTYLNNQFKSLVKVLIDWINDELASQRIIVQDLAEDLYDGQVLQKLLEKLTGDKLDVREVTQSEEGQKQKLQAVLSHFNYVLGLSRTGSKKWNVEAIHSKNIVSIMHLLVALARHFRPPVRLTEHVSATVVIVKKVNSRLEHRIVNEVITTTYDDVGMRCERDAIDSLFDHAPEKLQVVKKSLVTFVNKHLNKLNLEVTDLEKQFHDGVFLTFLMGLLEGFFVPLHSFYSTPKDFDQKVHNVAFAFELMEEMGITKLKARPEDIVNNDLKSTLRVLYTLFTKYKHI